jgi:predicted anti-sigma-YlaC factor YlaD
MMRCTTARKWISEQIDGELDMKRGAALEEHCAACSDCQKLMKDFQKISQSALQLKEVSPPESTWLKIQEKLPVAEQKVIKVAPGKPRWLSLPGLSYVASAALALLIVVGIFVIRPFDRNGQDTLAATKSQQYTLAKLQEAEHHYKLAIQALADAVAVQEEELDPKVAEVFRTNLAIIDASIDACQQAILNNPNNIESRDYLLAAYREKTNLLTQMMAVSDKPSKQRGMEETL